MSKGSFLVIGGGIVGLATAYKITERHPNPEREARWTGWGGTSIGR
jgi:glycine/D-amino acid oxidase-like deaminating enzyme